MMLAIIALESLAAAALGFYKAMLPFSCMQYALWRLDLRLQRTSLHHIATFMTSVTPP